MKNMKKLLMKSAAVKSLYAIADRVTGPHRASRLPG